MSLADTVGIVSDLQPFSLHDGPGIRTTVFLKGCPLRCAWCHNPETQQAAPVLAWQQTACTSCAACVPACPQGAHRLVDGRHLVARQDCRTCGACVPACPQRALEVVGRRLTAGAVLERVLADADFFRASGGGLTVSGGEPTAQPDFTLALLRLAGEAGVHRTVETCLVGPRLAEFVPLVELFLVDWKDSDDQRHRSSTGVGNAGIRAGILALHAAGARLRLRCPIIPGWNDRPDHFAGIAALVRELPRLEGVDLLPFHPLGGAKTARFGLPDPPCAGVRAPDAASVQAWRDQLRRHGVVVGTMPDSPLTGKELQR